ncbi:biotin-dependent carboxyltransferase family protein, partial [uncultured Paenibacillus sp.]
MSAVTVLKPGLFTTVQDMGRSGWRASGVAAGGAMDTYALRVANLLVGNAADSACLELTLTGATLRVERDLLVAVTGAYMAPEADGAEVPMWRPVWMAAGTTLSLGRTRAGCRAYVAAAGGFVVAPVLGSRSADVRAGFGGGFARPLAAGDTLLIGEAEGAEGRDSHARAAAPHGDGSRQARDAAAWAAAWAAALAQRAAE